MNIQSICVPPLGTNCYLLQDKNDVAIVDPGGDMNSIIRFIEKERLMPHSILLTHGHFDHTGAAGALKAHYGIPIYIHHKDEVMLYDAKSSHASRFGFSYDGCTADILLNDGDTVTLGETILTVLHTPGHTPGSICFLSGDVLISGDTLFCGSIGRFEREDKLTMKDSIQRLLTLDAGIKVYPGHDRATTIGQERMMNPFANFDWEWE